MIVKCKECGKDISTEAAACPGCGCPQKEQSSKAAEIAKNGGSHIYGWIALIAFFMSNFTPAIIAPLIILIAISFSLLEFKQGGKIFGGIVFFLCLTQVWSIADHFGGISAQLGLVNPKKIEQKMANKYENVDLGLPANAQQIIGQKCAEDWPNDFKMRNYCEGQQREGIATLNRGMPQDIAVDAFKVIRGKCASSWPRDFKMRAYCESQQYEGYRSLQSSSRSDGTRSRCAQKWPDDYKMQKYCEGKE